MEIFPLPFKLCRSVNSVGHDPCNGLLHVLHPLGHLRVAHFVDLLDEVVVFLPERHVAGRILLTLPKKVFIY